MRGGVSGDSPRNPTNVRAGIVRRARDQWLAVVVAVGAAVVFLHFAGGAHDRLAMAGIALVVGSFLPGAVGRAALVAAIVIAVTPLVTDPSASTLVLAVLIIVGAIIGRTFSARNPALTLLAAEHSTDRLARESVLLDERARTELTRARRYERPLSVIAVTTDADHKHRSSRQAIAAGRAMAATLRITDVVGVTADGDAIAVLPDTRRDAVAELMGRVQEAMAKAGVTGRVGYATFPEDAVTWRGLKDAAHRHGAVITAAAEEELTIAVEPPQLREQSAAS